MWFEDLSGLNDLAKDPGKAKLGKDILLGFVMGTVTRSPAQLAGGMISPCS